MADTAKIDLVWSNYIRDKNKGFDALYAMYHETLLSYCLGKLRHLDLAENAVADIFMKVLKYNNISKIENPDGWIFTLAKNHCLSYWNKENRRSQILSEVLTPSQSFEPHRVDGKIDFQTMKSLIEETLSKQELKIWQLHLEGFVNHEIAEKIDLNLKTVANKKTMIRNAIKDAIEKKLGYKKE